jgi:hypothetical protein
VAPPRNPQSRRTRPCASLLFLAGLGFRRPFDGLVVVITRSAESNDSFAQVTGNAAGAAVHVLRPEPHAQHPARNGSPRAVLEDHRDDARSALAILSGSRRSSLDNLLTCAGSVANALEADAHISRTRGQPRPPHDHAGVAAAFCTRERRGPCTSASLTHQRRYHRRRRCHRNRSAPVSPPGRYEHEERVPQCLFPGRTFRIHWRRFRPQ